MTDSVEKGSTGMPPGGWMSRILHLARGAERGDPARAFHGPSELGFLEDLQRRALSERRSVARYDTRRR